MTLGLQTTDRTDSITVPGKSRFPGALWRACARSFQGVRGDVITGLRLLRAGCEAGSAVFRLIAFLMAHPVRVADGNACRGDMTAIKRRYLEHNRARPNLPIG